MSTSVEMVNGTRTSFGGRDVEVQAPSRIPQVGAFSELRLEVNGDKLPAYRAGDETNTVFKGGEYIVGWYAYSETGSTASVQLDFVGADDGVSLGLAEPALAVATAGAWAKDSTGVVVPEAAQVVATGPAAGESAMVVIVYMEKPVV